MIVLAGGLGTRLRSAVADRPKPLAPVGGRPFLSYLLDYLSSSGVQRVVFATGFLGEQIEATFGDRCRGMRLSYSREEFPLGTAGAARRAAAQTDGNAVLILNGDSYCAVDLAGLCVAHRQNAGIATITLTRSDDCSRFGRVETEVDGRIRRFAEKEGRPGSGLVNAGVYVVDRAALLELPSSVSLSIERDVFPDWVQRGLHGFVTTAPLLDIGTPESYASAATFLGGNRGAHIGPGMD